MPGRKRPGRPRKPDLGQHFLASPQVAARLVADAEVGPAHRVVEFGAGSGVLTGALARVAAHVLAIELDSNLTTGLARRFADAANVTVLHADSTTLPLPVTPFRVVANLAFNTTAAMLHTLLDHPEQGLVRADLVVQWQVARDRARGADLLGVTWAPWWEFRRGRRIPASLFRPAPTVDAAVLIVRRRTVSLLPISEFGRYARWVRNEFGREPAIRTEPGDWLAAYRLTAGSRLPGEDGSGGRGP